MDAWRIRRVANWVNLSTPLGLGVARLGRAKVERGPRDLYVAGGYRLSFPIARAFTVGSVIISGRPVGWLEAHQTLLAHEERHATQWAVLGGLPFLPLYVVAMAYSQWRVGDRGAANLFERLAGLDDGGYRMPGPDELQALKARRRRRRRTVVARLLQ